MTRALCGQAKMISGIINRLQLILFSLIHCLFPAFDVPTVTSTRITPAREQIPPVNFANFTHPWPTRWDQIRRMRSGNGWRIVLGRTCAYKRVGIAFRIPMGIPLAIST